MALKSTIHKATLSISNLDSHYYNTHNLTIAKHPSETDLRMMIRILVFALHAHENLQFTKGLSTDDEPDLWRKSDSDEIIDWIELGQPDEKRIRRACGRASHVWIYCYSGNSADIWWSQNQRKLERFKNLSILNLEEASISQLTSFVEKTMNFQITIQDGVLWMSNDAGDSLELSPIILKEFNKT